MQALESILNSCAPSTESESPRRRRPSLLSISSAQSKTQSILSPIKETFDDFLHSVTEIPASIEEKFDYFCNGMADIPASIEETFDEMLQSVNEYVLLEFTEIGCSPRRSVGLYLM
jgi:hypothetical protein